ncbi:MAG: hypothetical protein GF418_12945 [Chitinivibrionales bacterium]|nr:hypothetical protein [Chitinivibrionales bacterium]MBD3396525.1 hypothetical protein [Chitinivibrionales bacterium]
MGSGAPKKTERAAAQSDTLKVIARLVEIAGTFPPNDLYNYVYVMKYRVLKVVNGSYDGKEIFVGHYNPLIPRAKIKDKMDPVVDGTVTGFSEGAKHELTLVTPVTEVWKEAVEDEYFDEDADKYFAVRADVVK